MSLPSVMDVLALVVHLPLNREEPAASLRGGRRDDGTHDGGVARHAHDAELDLPGLALDLRREIPAVVAGLLLEVGVDAHVAAREQQEELLGNLHGPGCRVAAGDRLGLNVRPAHEAVAGHEEF